MIKQMIGLTKALDYKILKHLGLEPNGNKFIFYEVYRDDDAIAAS
jgi:quinol monooxygenase YgiN